MWGDERGDARRTDAGGTRAERRRDEAGAPRRPGEHAPQGETPPQFPQGDWLDAPSLRYPGALAGEDTPDEGEGATVADVRLQARQLLREFLRAVPRSETEATIAIARADGTQRLFTRAELSAAIDRLRPRQRQILRLAVEERWSRQRVCAYLHNISVKTLERDQVEALDILAQM